MTRNRTLRWLALGLLVSCAGHPSKMLDLERLISQARTHGAQECAPIKLAMAESHSVFAVQEWRRGDRYGFNREMAIAVAEAQKALSQAQRAGCGEVEISREGDIDGDSVANATDKCPRRAEDMDGFADGDGCPDPDNDRDRVLDDVDRCRDVAEDMDGFADEDGCPDPDNDNDNVLDENDQCPNTAEDLDGFADEDGCPDCDDDSDGFVECPAAVDQCPDRAGVAPDGCPLYNLIRVSKNSIEPLAPIRFRSRRGGQRLHSDSLPTLVEIAQLLTKETSWRVQIVVHTDARGASGANLRLSKKRAEVVRRALARRGISEGRIDIDGRGEAEPISDNRTVGGRRANQRVEFAIVSR